MAPLNRLISSVVMFSLLPTFFHGPRRHVVRADVRSTTTTSRSVDQDATSEGLQIRLSEGVEQPEPRSATQPAAATELSQSETENILKRLPPMTEDASDAQKFALREGSLPPPRTGNTIDVSFPAPATAANETVTSGPLEVLRYSPEGSVPLAPELSITFSQPMVALTSQEEASTNVPVKLSPQPPGRWRWLGTKTLIFQPDGRFPMSTSYLVTVPAGTRAANGSTLAAEKSWTFTTPPLSVKASYPSKDSTQPRDALMFIEFDQRIDPAAVLPAIRVTSAGRILKTRLANSDEVKKEIARDQTRHDGFKSGGQRQVDRIPRDRSRNRWNRSCSAVGIAGSGFLTRGCAVSGRPQSFTKATSFLISYPWPTASKGLRLRWRETLQRLRLVRH